MSENIMNAVRLLSLLPEKEQNTALEFIKKMVQAWDPDFTKVTTEEAARIAAAEASGFIADDEIDWDNLSKYDK